jgi:peroxiredoxin
VDTIACIAVNDAFVMNAWGQADEVGDRIRMLADGSGEFAAAGLQLDVGAFGLGMRSHRYVAIISVGIVRDIRVEAKPAQV